MGVLGGSAIALVLLMGELGVDWLQKGRPKGRPKGRARRRPTGEFGTDWDRWGFFAIGLVLKVVLIVVLIVEKTG